MIFLALIDIVGALIIGLCIANHALVHFSTGFKAGLVLCMLGMLYTAAIIIANVKPTVPVWALKDLGISAVAWFWLRHKLKGLK